MVISTPLLWEVAWPELSNPRPVLEWNASAGNWRSTESGRVPVKGITNCGWKIPKPNPR